MKLHFLFKLSLSFLLDKYRIYRYINIHIYIYRYIFCLEHWISVHGYHVSCVKSAASWWIFCSDLAYITLHNDGSWGRLKHKYDSGQSNIISIPDRRPCLRWSLRFGTKTIVLLLWGSDVIWRASNQSVFSLSWYHLPIYHQPSNQPVSIPPML